MPLDVHQVATIKRQKMLHPTAGNVPLYIQASLPALDELDLA